MVTARRCSVFVKQNRNEREVDIFLLLKKTYVHARYKDVFTIIAEEAGVLLERVNLVLDKITGEFKRLVVVQRS